MIDIKMKLIYYPDEILSKQCDHVSTVTNKQTRKDRRIMACQMSSLMIEKNGIGLSAPQVGLNIRMFVWNHLGDHKSIWNPFLSDMEGNVESTESCLSLPSIEVKMQRWGKAVLSGIDVNGYPILFVGHGILSTVWQHEICHLDGKLIIDDMTPEEERKNRDAIICLRNKVRQQ